MELTFEDHKIFENYITANMKKNVPIELLIEPNDCYHYNTQININNSKEYLNNLDLLLNYLIENNLFINVWKINSSFDIFSNQFGYELLDKLYVYFVKFSKPGKIFYKNNLLSFNSQQNINNFELYLNKFLDINVFIIISYQTEFNNVNNLNKKLLQFLTKYNYKIYIIINNSLDNSINNYKLWRQIYNQYYNNNNNQFSFIFKIDKTINWNDQEIEKYLTLLNFIIDDRYQMCNYNIEEFTQHLFFPASFLSIHNILQHDSEDILSINHFNKYKTNNTICKLESQLFINLKDLSFPVCNGILQNYYCGGQLTSDKIVAHESINGYFSQRSINNFFLPDCFGCENNFFCDKGCRAAQIKYHFEPFICISNICNLLNTSLNTLIKRYHQLGVFDYLFTQTDLELGQTFKHDLIQILKVKGYPEYEYRYN